MKKVWLISYHLDGVTAGPSIRFQRYAPLLMQKGIRLVFITIWKNPALPKFEQRENFDIIRIRSNSAFGHMSLFVLKALLLSLVKKGAPEYVMTFTYNNIQLLVMPILYLFGKKVIYISTMDFDSQMNDKNVPQIFINKGDYLLTRLLFRLSYAIVTSSDVLADNYRYYNLPPGKVRIISNGVDTIRFSPPVTGEKILLRKELNLPKNSFIYLYAGLRTQRKGIKLLIESWAIHFQDNPEDILLLVGNEKPEATSSDFREYWASMKLRIDTGGTGIILHDNNPQIEKYFKSADCFIFLSEKEGMPNVLLEAMSSGLPVITANFKGFSGIYGKNENEFLLVKKNSDVVTLMSQIRNNELQKKLSENARKYSVENFSLVKSIDHYAHLLNA